MSITLMNGAMACAWNKNSIPRFRVQSKKEVWWLGAFEVDSEYFEILHWVFHKTSIPSIINSQEGGTMLHVEGFGDYRVQWHMAGDLKTLKCNMYNISKGPISKSLCLYCMGSAQDCQPSRWNRPPDRHLRDKAFHVCS